MFSVVLSLILLGSIFPINLFTASAVYYKPGDIIIFGSYPQTRVKDIAVINALDARMSPVDSPVTYLGAKYKKVFFTQYTPYNSRLAPTAENSYQDDNGYYVNTSYWFKYEPIQWRVLANTGGELFLVSDKILDAKPYNVKYSDVTWETSTARSWLNKDFYNSAFSLLEKSRILTSTVINDDNPFYKTEGGNNTKDNLFMLSFKEVMTASYGFETTNSTSDVTRKAQGTDYAKCEGLYVYDTSGTFASCSNWWLRSPGSSQNRAGYINYLPVDMIGFFYSGSDVDYNDIGIRPALKLKGLTVLTASDNPTFVADSVNNFIYGINAGTTKAFFESSLQLASGTKLEYIPDNGTLNTGTVVNLIDTATNQILESYTIVVFGDVNGDGNIDSIDAGIITDVENYITAWNPATDAALYKAGDLNGDGNVDSIDAGIAVDAQNYVVTIDQTTGLAVPN